MKPMMRGSGSDALFELVEMYPTLCDLAGVPLPDHWEEASVVPLLDDPTAEWETRGL